MVLASPNRDEWLEARDRELQAHADNGTGLELCRSDLPPGAHLKHVKVIGLLYCVPLENTGPGVVY